MENQDFYNFFAGSGMTAGQSPASIVQNVNMENELGTMQKPPKLMNLDEYAGWSDRFKNWVQANHFECWMKIEAKYVPPVDGLGMEKGIGSLTETEQNDFKAEKKMISILQQAIKEDILVLLQHEDNAQSMWQSLKIKFQGSVSMIKSKKALIKKEFDIFTGMKGETTRQLIERYCHLVLEIMRLEIIKINEEWIDMLSDALPYDEWGTYLMMLKNNSDFVNLNLSSFIEKIEVHELELLKIKKMNSANVQQGVSLYYKGNTPAQTNLSPKIQTGFSADTTSSASSNTPQTNKSSPFASFEPNVKVTEQTSPQSSSSSNNQAYIKNGNEFIESAAKQHIALLASMLESYESLVAGKIGNPDMTKEDYDQIDPEELELIDIKWGMASLVRRAQRFMEITGRNSLSGPDQKLGFDKSKVTCFKCKERGHFKRECPNREVNNHQNPFTNDYYRQAIYHRPNQQPVVQRPQIENKPEKVLIVNQGDEKVAEGFSWDKYITGSDGQAMMAEIVEETESFFEEPTNGLCPRYEEKKESVEEMIDVTKELTEDTLKEIADRALMAKLKEVDTELVKPESVGTESVQKDSDQESGIEEVKSKKVSESESKDVGKQEVKTAHEAEVVEKVISMFKTPCQKCLKPCMECLEKDAKFQELKQHADTLKFDLGQVKEAYDTLARSDKMIQKESVKNDKAMKLTKATLFDKQVEVNFHLDTIASLKKELGLTKIENELIDKKLMSYVASSYVLEQIVPQ
ncbi:putative transcription factor interactor and regulator CCHC(Zn) family [Helianthus annuus]|nr:putative transcription factor interactor and regulator CCHC(Zn) family [Helianthus annuus]